MSQRHLMCHSNMETINASHGTPCSAFSHLGMSLLRTVLRRLKQMRMIDMFFLYFYLLHRLALNVKIHQEK